MAIIRNNDIIILMIMKLWYMAPTVFIESNSKYDKLNDCSVQTSIEISRKGTQ